MGTQEGMFTGGAPSLQTGELSRDSGAIQDGSRVNQGLVTNDQ
ncbi:MAG: hypothetical protein R3C14_31130 [Caldilineaceae bacterium]